MDISPKTLREVEFREKFRGYHPEDVDTFLEQVALGVEALQNQLRQATERAAHAEQLANASGTTDEALSRTLLLAQRTADMAVEEAREQAERVVAAAESQARIIVDEANQRAQRIAEESQASLRQQLAELEEARGLLQADVDVLHQWIEQHRTSVSSALQDLLRQVDNNLVAHAAPPVLADVRVPPAADAPEAEPPTAADVHVDAVDHDQGDHDQGDEVDEQDDGDIDGGEIDEADHDALDEAGLDDSGEADEAVDGETGAAGGDEPPLPEEGGGTTTVEAAADDEPPEAEDVAVEHGDDDDPFMAELRRAVTDTEPLGPRDDDAPAIGSDADTGLAHGFDASRRFGPRLRRKR